MANFRLISIAFSVVKPALPSPRLCHPRDGATGGLGGEALFMSRPKGLIGSSCSGVTMMRWSEARRPSSEWSWAWGVLLLRR